MSKTTLALPIAMLTGVLSYFILKELLPSSVKPILADSIGLIQPLLIATMLFISFCKLKVSEIRPKKWHLWGLSFQIITSLLACLALHAFNVNQELSVILETILLCAVCPTATAAVVITTKLGENTGSLAAYTVFSTLLSAALVPLLSSMIFEQTTHNFSESFVHVAMKVSPLLLVPLVLSQVIRKLSPCAIIYLSERQHIAFYLWAVALTMAIACTAQNLYHSSTDWTLQLIIAMVTLGMCILQFAIGKKIGKTHSYPISASQALGQKNTVLLIWLTCTFFHPEVAAVGGFYSIWHNLYNSWQLSKALKERN